MATGIGSVRERLHRKAFVSSISIGASPPPSSPHRSAINRGAPGPGPTPRPAPATLALQGLASDRDLQALFQALLPLLAHPKKGATAQTREQTSFSLWPEGVQRGRQRRAGSGSDVTPLSRGSGTFSAVVRGLSTPLGAAARVHIKTQR